MMTYRFSWLGMALMGMIGCGKSLPSHLNIVGGAVVPTPSYVAGIIDENEEVPGCGGVFIAQDAVLTSAHCVSNRLTSLNVMSGSQMDGPKYSGRRLSVRAVHIHPDFNPFTGSNDIALLFLRETDGEAYPILLNDDALFPDQSGDGSVVLGGRGNFSNLGGIYQNAWRSVTLSAIAPRSCRALLGQEEREQFSRADLCVSNVRHPGGATCDGDTGGPAVSVRGDGKNVLVGLIRFAAFEGCASEAKPQILTRVSAFLPWIKDNLMRDQRPVQVPTEPFLERLQATCTVPYWDHQEERHGEDFLRISTLVKPGNQWSPSLGAEQGAYESMPYQCAVPVDELHEWKVLLERKIKDKSQYRYHLIGPSGEEGVVNARTQRHVDLICQEPDLSLRFSPDRSQNVGNTTSYFDNFFFAGSDVFSIEEVSAGTFRSRSDDLTCAVAGYQVVVPRSISRTKSMIKISGPMLGERPLTLDIAAVNPTEVPVLTLHRRSESSGYLEWNNPGTLAILTWELACPFALTLDLNGPSLEPQKQKDDLWHLVVELPRSTAVLPAGRSVFFRYRSQRSIGSGAEGETCFMNGIPLHPRVR